MRKHLSAAHARARAARSCLGIVTGSLVVIGLTACGGGGDPAPSNEQTQAQGLSDSTAKAQSLTSTPASGLITGEGWVAQLPDAAASDAYTASHTATAYYIRPDGNDNLAGTSPETAWKTLAKASSKTDYQAGDAILLKCGETWQDKEMAFSGDANPSIKNGVLLAAYGCDGTKKRPIITGASALPVVTNAAWNTLSTQPAVRTIALSAPIKRLFLNGVPQMPARYPNEQGNSRFAAATPLPAVSGETPAQEKARKHRFFKITGTDLSAVSSQDLVGATVHVRTNPYTVETALIQSFNGSTGVVELASELAFPIAQDAGYILEGKTWMVDQAGEWALDSSNVLHYASSAPVTQDLTAMVRRLTAGGAAKKTYGLWFHKVDNMRIEHLRFEYNEASIDLSQSQNVTVRGVESAYAHEDGLLAGNSPNLQVIDSRFDASGRDGIRIMASNNAQVTGNVVSRTGKYFSAQPIGAGVTSGISFTGWAIRVDGTDSLVEANLVQDSANTGIMFSNRTGTIVRHNTVLRPCMLLTDCGGIYTHSDAHVMAPTSTPTSQVHGNLVAGLQSNLDGSFRYGGLNLIAGQNQANGIYLDANSTNIEVFNNVVSGAEVGIYLHNSSYNIIRNNETQGITYASLHISSDATDAWATRGNQVLNNNFFSRRTEDLAAFSNMPYKGVRGDQTYAQLWHNSQLDAKTFFSDKTVGVTDRNVSSGNTTLSLTKVTSPTIWRAESPDRRLTAYPMLLEQVSGSVWGLRTQNAPIANLGADEWLSVTSASASTPDSESSPVTYRMHTQSLQPLLNNGEFESGQSNTWATAQGTLLYLTSSTNCRNIQPTCGYYFATGVNDLLSSASFDLVADNLYMASYTMSSSASASARHSAHIGTSSAPATATELVSPLIELKPGEVRRVQTYVRPATGFNAKLALRASDGTTAWTNKVMYFASAGVARVTNTISVLPPLHSLSMSAVNASGADRSFTCADLGASDCTRVVDAQGTAVSFPVSVPARSATRFYVKSLTWTN